MKKRNEKLNFIVRSTTVICLMLLFGCDSFLNEVPTDRMTTDNFNITTDSDIEAVVAGPYRSLTNWTSVRILLRFVEAVMLVDQLKLVRWTFCEFMVNSKP